MSRVGRVPITVPPGVTVDIKGSEVTVTGPKGELSRCFSPDMFITLNDNTLAVSRPSDSKEHRSLHGLTRSLLANMVDGVSRGFEKNLEIVGVGYRVEKSGDKLVFRVGFSHLVDVEPIRDKEPDQHPHTKAKDQDVQDRSQANAHDALCWQTYRRPG